MKLYIVKADKDDVAIINKKRLVGHWSREKKNVIVNGEVKKMRTGQIHLKVENTDIEFYLNVVYMDQEISTIGRGMLRDLNPKGVKKLDGIWYWGVDRGYVQISNWDKNEECNMIKCTVMITSSSSSSSSSSSCSSCSSSSESESSRSPSPSTSNTMVVDKVKANRANANSTRTDAKGRDKDAGIGYSREIREDVLTEDEVMFNGNVLVLGQSRNRGVAQIEAGSEHITGDDENIYERLVVEEDQIHVERIYKEIIKQQVKGKQMLRIHKMMGHIDTKSLNKILQTLKRNYLVQEVTQTVAQCDCKINRITEKEIRIEDVQFGRELSMYSLNLGRESIEKAIVVNERSTQYLHLIVYRTLTGLVSRLIEYIDIITSLGGRVELIRSTGGGDLGEKMLVREFSRMNITYKQKLWPLLETVDKVISLSDYIETRYDYYYSKLIINRKERIYVYQYIIWNLNNLFRGPVNSFIKFNMKIDNRVMFEFGEMVIYETSDSVKRGTFFGYDLFEKRYYVKSFDGSVHKVKWVENVENFCGQKIDRGLRPMN